MARQRRSGDGSEKRSGKKELKFDWSETPSGLSDFQRRRPEPLRDPSREEDDEDMDLPRAQQPRTFNPSEHLKKKKGGSRRRTEDDEDTNEGGYSKKAFFFFLLMALPAIIEMIDVSSGVLRGLQKAAESVYHQPQTLIYPLAVVAIPILLSFIIPRRWLVRLSMLAAVTALILPTANTYMCAPAYLNNTHFGTNFSLRTRAKDVMSGSLTGCLQGHLFAKYSMSLYTPRLALHIHRSSVQELNITSDGDTPLPYRLLVLSSPRSVRGHLHQLHTIAKVTKRLANRGVLNDLLARNTTDLAVYRILGRLLDLPNAMHPMHASLQRQGMYVRPLLFEAHDIQLIG